MKIFALLASVGATSSYDSTWSSNENPWFLSYTYTSYTLPGCSEIWVQQGNPSYSYSDNAYDPLCESRYARDDYGLRWDLSYALDDFYGVYASYFPDGLHYSYFYGGLSKTEPNYNYETGYHLHAYLRNGTKAWTSYDFDSGKMLVSYSRKYTNETIKLSSTSAVASSN